MPEDVSVYPPRKKKAPVWVWLLLGCGGLAVLGAAGVVALVMYAVGNTRIQARKAMCRSNLRQVGLAIHMYADDHDEKFPPDLQVLMPDYIDNPRVLKCPGRPGATYTYLPGRKAVTPGDVVIAYEDPDNHSGRGFNVLYADAHVETWPNRRLGEFQDLVARQNEAIRKAAEARKQP